MSDLSNEAKFLLNNAAFMDAIDVCRKQATNSALACDVHDDQGRRRYLDAVRTVDKVVGHLTALMAASDKDEVEPDNFYTDRAKGRFAEFAKLLNI